MNFYKKNFLNDPHFGNEIKTKRGSSETLRNESCFDFHWLAGLIDADGGFYISRGRYVSCEITMHEKEVQTLYWIKRHLGGSLTPRVKKKAFRWRLHKKQPIDMLLKQTNGYYQTQRVQNQYQKACTLYGIVPFPPEKISLETAWLAGFFSGDGSFSIKSRAGFQPSASIGQTEKAPLDSIAALLGGGVYYDKFSASWIWWTDVRSCPLLIEYLKKFHLRNPSKQARFKSIRRFLGYLERGLHRDPQQQARLLHFVKLFQAFVFF